MSVIDQKGKIGGKINIIDLVAVILIIAVVALLGMKFVSNTSDGLGNGGIPCVYTVKVTGVDKEVYESIQKELPSQLMASGEYLNATITDVEATPVEDDTYTVQTIPDYEGVVLKHQDAGSYDLLFTIEGSLDTAVNHEIGTQEIRIGKSHIVKTDSIELTGGIIQSLEILDEAAE